MLKVETLNVINITRRVILGNSELSWLIDKTDRLCGYKRSQRLGSLDNVTASGGIAWSVPQSVSFDTSIDRR